MVARSEADEAKALFERLQPVVDRTIGGVAAELGPGFDVLVGVAHGDFVLCGGRKGMPKSSLFQFVVNLAARLHAGDVNQLAERLAAVIFSDPSRE
jgi:hypothetical protein